MNKSTVERLTEGKVNKISRESFLLTYGYIDKMDTSVFINFGPVKGKKESQVFQKLHDLFWNWRRKQIMEFDSYKCVECSSPFGLSVDHKINRSQGGTHNVFNLQTLCAKCHYDKTYLKGKWAKS